nr:VOC family protein [Haematobacter massiliensis]
MRAAQALRIARPSDDLEAVVAFYRDGLGLEVIASFEAHDGFDGVMLGKPGIACHLEFTRKSGHPAGRAPTQDNLLVFYIPDPEEWQAAGGRRQAAGGGRATAARGLRSCALLQPLLGQKRQDIRGS